MRAKKAKTEIRRAQIAEAALGLVERHGLKGLNYTRLAGAVGVVPSGLYRHYPDKNCIIEAVLDLIQQRLEANVTRVRREPGNALQRLHTLLNLHVRLPDLSSPFSAPQETVLPARIPSTYFRATNCI